MQFNDLFKFIKDAFEKFKFTAPSIVKSRPFHNDPINMPRGHANSSCTKKAHTDSRNKKRKCRLSHMQRRSMIRAQRG